MQFIPIVERWAKKGIQLADPPLPDKKQPRLPIPEWAVTARDFGQFYIDIFDIWIRYDVGKFFVQYFDTILALLLGSSSPVCAQAETCGRAGVIEHNGDVYACDHFVYPEYRLGNIMENDLQSMFNSSRQLAFGNAKRDKLPEYCRQCPYLKLCHGGCPKHRFLITPDGQPGLNYLCQGYRMFLEHSIKFFQYMANLYQHGFPPAGVMDYAQNQNNLSAAKIPRNAPCPCGSGKKYKNCHLKK